jgi:sugar phosphate isomerase/epimerase
VKGTASANGVEITELSTHLQGQLVAVHPAYDEGFDAFAPVRSMASRRTAAPGRKTR